jgi:hypothetical protein
MKYILSFVTFIFSSIFYFFSVINTSSNKWEALDKGKFYNLETLWDLKILSIVFLAIWVFFLFYFSDFSNLKPKETKKFDFKQIPKYTVSFFKNYVYYIWIILFYTAIFFILKDFSFFKSDVFIFILNLLIIFLFFLNNKFFIFKDFIKINTIIFSLFYIWFYIYFSYLWINKFSLLDLFNQVSIICFFLLTIYNDKILLKKDYADTPLIFYFFVYIFWFLYFYLKWLWLGFSMISYIWFFLSVFIYYFLVKIPFFSKNIFTLKVLSILFLYVSTISSIIFNLKIGVSIPMLFIILYSFVFNFIVHDRYGNYISLFFSISSLAFFIFYTYFEFFHNNNLLVFLIVSMFLSFFIILFTYFYKIKYYTDYYFLHIYSYIINIICVLYFFFQSSFDFFTFWIILLLESIFVFLSYYRFKTIK